MPSSPRGPVGGLVGRLATLFLLCAACLAVAGPALASAPAAKPAAGGEGRVKQLASFFKLVNEGNFKAIQSFQKDRVETVPALQMLRALISDQPQEFKCGKYYKLIQKPIKLTASIEAIAEEERISAEVQNLEANLVAGLENEKNYNPLNKILAIIDTLDTETLLPAPLKNELVGCISYFVHRYRNALLRLVDYIEAKRTELRPELVKPRTQQELERKMEAKMAEIEQLEAQSEFETHYEPWIEAMESLGALVIELETDVPRKVQDFLIDRSKGLAEQEENVRRLQTLKRQVVQLEALKRVHPIDMDDYETLLNQIQYIAETEPGPYKQDINSFLIDSQRIRPAAPVSVEDEMRKTMAAMAAELAAEKERAAQREAAKKEKKKKFGIRFAKKH